MSFLKDLLHRKKCTRSSVLVDIAADSVAGAYAHYIQNETPVLIYVRRLPIENKPGEPRESAMLRALEVLGNDLIREGAPVLMRATGSGRADNILVSIDTPWQETSVRAEHFERKDPFILTKSIVDTALDKVRAVPPDKVLADESIIGTILNGYETRDPYGKKVHRATFIVLTSLIDKKISDSIISTLRGLYHTKDIAHTAGSSLRYQVIRTVFPHEREALILDATGPITSVSLVRNGLFIALSEIPPTENKESWTSVVMKELGDIVQKYPLPRTIFLLSRELDVSSLKETLEKENIGKLWLSDNPPKIVPVVASHIIGSVRQTSDSPPDLQLLLMALYCERCGAEKKLTMSTD